MKTFSTWALLATSFGLVAGDCQYRSRLDLSPPRLNITIPPTDEVADGYLFVAPYSAVADGSIGPDEPAAYIFRDNGDLVWSSTGKVDGYVGNFHVTQWGNETVLGIFHGRLDLAHGHGYGHVALLDRHYENIHEVHTNSPHAFSIHEYTSVDGRTAMSEIFEQTVRNLTEFGATEDQRWIANGLLQEYDIATGEVVFEWNSLDHVNPSHSELPIAEGTAGNGSDWLNSWDYFHINSVDKDDEDNYLVSARRASTVYKLDGKTGEIMWQLGGKTSDFDYDDELEFAFQHDARFRGRKGDLEYISFFDNSARSKGHETGDVKKIRDYSSGKYVVLNKKTGKAELETHLIHPDRLLAGSQGNVQALSNGNSFVNWGQKGTVTEHNANGTAIFSAYLESGFNGDYTQNYRGFRFNWSGSPSEPPSLVARTDESGHHSKLILYVSWNGDTETNTWRFSAKGTAKHLQPLGERKRLSFETSFEVDESSRPDVVVAEAVDSQGKVHATVELQTNAALPDYCP